MNASASAQDSCPEGQSLRGRLILETPSRLVNMYTMPEGVDEDGYVEIEVFENTELVTIPAIYEWIKRPPDYQAPQTIAWTEMRDISEVRCTGHYEQPIFNVSDKFVSADQSISQMHRTYLGARIEKRSCRRVTINEPVIIHHEIDYDPQTWEKDDQIRILKSPAKTVPRKLPPIFKKKKAEPTLYGRSYRSAELVEEQPQCLWPLKSGPKLKETNLPVTYWSVVYLKGYDENNPQMEGPLKRLSPVFDLSSAVLTTGIDPKTMDVVWHAFTSGCDPVVNDGLNKHGEPLLDSTGKRHWMPGGIQQTACTVLFEDTETGQTTERFLFHREASHIFKTDIGPAKNYHLLDMKNGILIWYNEDGEEIARFHRIDEAP